MNTVPDGTKVRFTDEAKDLMTNPVHQVHLSTPKLGVDTVYTIDNTDDTLHDVILRETGERWAYTWLEPADERDRMRATVQADVDAIMRHSLMQDNMAEYRMNMNFSERSLEQYGLEKCVRAAAYLASCRAHGFDVDDLRDTPEEQEAKIMELMQAFAAAGKPVMIVRGDTSEGQQS